MIIEEIMLTGNEVAAYQQEAYEALGGTYERVDHGTIEGVWRREEIGLSLRQTREHYGLSRAAIARETGIGATTLRRLELGDKVSTPGSRQKSYLLAIEAIMMRKRLSEYIVEQMHDWDVAVGD